MSVYGFHKIDLLFFDFVFVHTRLAHGDTFQHGVGHFGGEQLDGADGVVVGRDDEIDRIGIAVGIDQGDHRDVAGYWLL